VKRLPQTIKEVIIGYRESYKKGVEKFGIWWTIFQLSIWGFILIFLITAAVILVAYLPQIEMIYWELR
jgi:ABC-type multidrug transport system permease subunit